MTVISGELNFHIECPQLSHSRSESCKVRTLHGWCNSFFWRTFYILVESNASITPKENLYFLHTINKTISVTFSMYFMFQQLFLNIHYRLCDSKFWQTTIWPSGGLHLVTDKPKKTKKDNKPFAEQEPHSAYGRLINLNYNNDILVCANFSRAKIEFSTTPGLSSVVWN